MSEKYKRWHAKHKDTPKFKADKAARDKRYYLKNREKLIFRRKLYAAGILGTTRKVEKS